MNESVSKRRKLILESDDSEPEEVKSKKKNTMAENKEASNVKPVKKASPKRETSPKPESPKKSKNSPKNETKEEKEKTKPTKMASPKRETSPKKSKVAPNKEAEEEKTKPAKKASPKRETSPKPQSPKKSKVSPKKEAEDPNIKPKVTEKATENKEMLYSKSTSVFFGGKKVQVGTAQGLSEANAKDAKNEGDSSREKVYTPNKDNYHPIKDATWEKNAAVPYQALAQTLYCMEKTTKRLELLSIVSNYFRSLIALSPNDLVPSIFMLTNKVAPDYDNIELGIGDTVLFKALGEATGCTLAKLKAEFQIKGDIGLVAEVNIK
jgi:DNA ligase-1